MRLSLSRKPVMLCLRHSSSCPVRFRTSPSLLRRLEATPTSSSPSSAAAASSSSSARTVYVVGGLYGNPYALEKILEMAERENVKIGHKPAIFYNGDFNFFNSHSVHDFLLVNKMIMQSGGIASLGNIEDFIINACADPASLLDSETWDCGCDYPPFVSDAYVQRSNRIAARIGHVAQAALARDSSVIEWMRSLPNHHAIELGAGAEGERTRRVVVLHGDCWSLSGWRFAAEALPTSGGGG